MKFLYAAILSTKKEFWNNRKVFGDKKNQTKESYQNQMILKINSNGGCAWKNI